MEELINSSNIMTKIEENYSEPEETALIWKCTVSVFHVQHLDEEKYEWNNVAPHRILRLSSELWEGH